MLHSTTFDLLHLFWCNTWVWPACLQYEMHVVILRQVALIKPPPPQTELSEHFKYLLGVIDLRLWKIRSKNSRSFAADKARQLIASLELSAPSPGAICGRSLRFVYAGKTVCSDFLRMSLYPTLNNCKCCPHACPDSRRQIFLR